MSEKKKIATREGFGKEIVALGKENPDILVVDIDIGKSCKTGDFRSWPWPRRRCSRRSWPRRW